MVIKPHVYDAPAHGHNKPAVFPWVATRHERIHDCASLMNSIGKANFRIDARSKLRPKLMGCCCTPNQTLLRVVWLPYAITRTPYGSPPLSSAHLQCRLANSCPS